MVYAALLRGINVGGNNRVEMPRLKAVFEKAGFKKTATYINSGNVIFESDSNQKQLAGQIEQTIEAEFGFNVPVAVRSVKNIQAVSQAVPPKWANDTEQKTDVLFLWDEVNKPDIIEQFEINPEFERLIYVDGALVWNVDRKYINRSGMIKIIGTSFYKQITARNINTVRKLASMMADF